MSTHVYLSQEALDKLKEDLRHAKKEGRQEIAHAIAEARAQGDLSENAEYDAAKEAQGLLEARIAKLEETLSQARLVDETQMDNSRVYIMSTVRLKNLKANKEVTYTLVSPEEADMKADKISIKSPVGQGLLQKSVGDKVKITVPAGILEFEILEITRN